MHENSRPGIPAQANRSRDTLVPGGTKSNGTNRLSSGQGVPSITAMRPMPARNNSADSYAGGVAQPRRRTQSELGYNAPKQSIARRQSLRRMGSNQSSNNNNRNGSDTSSIRQKKKGGFFKAIAKLFKSPAVGSSGGSGSVIGSRRGGADSPPLVNRNKSGWNTRTDGHIKQLGGMRRNVADSSDDDEPSNLVAVTNMGNQTWSVDQVGKAPAPAAPLTSQRRSRSDLGAKTRSDSASTITGANKSIKTSKPPTASGAGSIHRSGTAKTTNSSAMDSPNKRLRDGSITRATGKRGTIGGAPSSSSVIEGNKNNKSSSTPSDGPKMMEIPTAPKSQVTPKMFTVTAPPPISAALLQSPSADAFPTSSSQSTVSKASTVKESQNKSTTAPALKRASSASSKAPTQSNTIANLGLGAPVAATNNGSAAATSTNTSTTNTDGTASTAAGMSLPNESVDSIVARHGPLPPSASLAPPTKSAMRGAAPQPYIVTAPPAIVQDKPKEEETVSAPTSNTTGGAAGAAPSLQRTNSVMTSTETESVYESAQEDDDRSAVPRNAVATNNAVNSTPAAAAGHAQETDSTPRKGGYGEDSDGSDVTVDPSKYQVIENVPRGAGAGNGIPAAPVEPPAAAKSTTTAASAPSTTTTKPTPAPIKTAPAADKPVPRSAPSITESAIERRKSVRMAVPDSPLNPTGAKPNPLAAAGITSGPPSSEMQQQQQGWNSRVGQIQDSSDDEDNSEYAKARRNLTNSTRKMKSAGNVPSSGKEKRKSTSTSGRK